jgi:hypothetical protein
MNDPQDALGAAYEILLAHCAPLTFPAPWGFLPPHPCCRGPVRDPGAALAALRAKFPDALLSAAGLLEPGPDGLGRLRLALAGPAGAVVALRRHPQAAPFALLTAAGCLPAGRLPVKAALEDGPIGAATRGRPLLVAADVLEVALLLSLNYPATLASGLDTLGLPGLREVDAQFGRGTSLVLLGWRPLVPAAGPAAAIAPAAAQLVGARAFLGLPLNGVRAWDFYSQEIDNLLYRLSLQDVGLVRELLQDSFEQPADLDELCPGAAPTRSTDPPPPGYAAAHAGLLDALAERRQKGQASFRLHQAQAAYEEAVRRELIAPLQEWALASDDPVIRAAGLELTELAGALRQMGPHLVDQLRDHLAWPRGAEAAPSPLFGQRLAMTSRLVSLMRDLARWRDQS